MAVLTESSLRGRFFKERLKDSVLKLPHGTIITPSAKSYLNEKKITIKFVESDTLNNDSNASSIDEEPQKTNHHQSLPVNKTVKTDSLGKYPDSLVPHHPHFQTYDDYERLIWLSKMDALQANIIEIQMRLSSNVKLTQELGEVLTFTRRLLRVEERGESLGRVELLELSESDIHSIILNPKKHFGIDYFYPDYQYGLEIVLLNSLRTTIREVELFTYQLFAQQENVEGSKDVLGALNLLTSVCWLMMFKSKTGDYIKEVKR